MDFYISQSLEEYAHQIVQHRLETISDHQTRIAKKALWISSAMSAIPGVEQTYRNPDENAARKSLRRITQPYYDTFLRNFDLKKVKIHYHKKPARSFLRIWRREGANDGGDDISAFRNTVLDISKNHKPITGLEIGRGGLVIRGLSPINHQGVYYGSVEALFDYSEIYNQLDKSESLAIFLKPEIAAIVNEPRIKANFLPIGDRVLYSSSSSDVQNYFTNNGKILFAELSKSKVVHVDDHFVSMAPLLDFRNKPIGSLVLGSNASVLLRILSAIRFGLAFMIMITGFASTAVIVYYGRKLTLAILDVADSLASISEGEGDLTIELKPPDRHKDDEIGLLSSNFNRFLKRIRNVIAESGIVAAKLKGFTADVTGTTHKFSDHTQSQAASAEEVNASAQQIHSGMEDVSSSVAEQRTALDYLKKRIDGLSVDGHKMSVHIRETYTLTGAMNQKAAAGEKALNAMVASVARIKDGADQMNQIVSLINDISEKVNLLALNAAIESARAGEAGRGFAVVAEEISRLADQTASSIKDITTLIKSNSIEMDHGQSMVQNVNEVIQTLIQDVDNVSTMIRSVDEFMQDLSEGNAEVNQKAEEVRQNAEQMEAIVNSRKEALAEISSSISDIDNQTQQIATGAENVSSAAEKVAQMTQELHTRISFFKV